MPDSLYPTPELSAMFIQKSYGVKPLFRGMHAITGDMTKSDGARTPVYAYLAGEAIKVAMQKANPEPVTVTIDAYLQAIADLVGTPQQCPIDVLLVIDNCLSPQQKRSWGRWGSNEPQMFIIMPEAYIEQRTISNVLSRDGQQNPVTGGVQLKFDDWKIIRGGSAASLTTVVADTTTVGVATTHCDGCLDANCGGVEGCSVWYVAAANGEVWKSINGGTTWTDVTPSTEWTAGTCIYADQLVIMAGGNDGEADDFGIKRSLDGGTTWSEVVFDTAGLATTVGVNQIIRYQDDFLAFTDDGVYRSTNDGLTWTQVDANTGMLSGALDENGFGVAVTAATLYITTNGGITWSALTVDPGGTAMKDVAIVGGYAHVVDSAIGYFRATVPALKADEAVWTEMDSTAGITDIMFCSRMMGYRLRGTSLDRTLNGGYSWEEVSVTGSAPTFAQMATCGGRLAIAGGVYFTYFNPYFDTSTYVGSGGGGCGC